MYSNNVNTYDKKSICIQWNLGVIILNEYNDDIIEQCERNKNMEKSHSSTDILNIPVLTDIVDEISKFN